MFPVSRAATVPQVRTRGGRERICMESPPPSDVTRLLERMNDGDRRATSELFHAVYEDLRHRARAYMATERLNHTLQATALVNEAFLKIVGRPTGTAAGASPWRGREH